MEEGVAGNVAMAGFVCMPPAVRQVVPEDLRRILEIEESVFRRPYDLVIFWIYMDAENAVFNVATCINHVIGYYILLLHEHIAHLISIALDKRYWGLGLGGYLLDRAINDAWSHGASEIVLEVRVSNKRAQYLYLSRGFRVSRVLEKYYGDEDAYLMRLAKRHQ